jgi:hypothetical protein
MGLELHQPNKEEVLVMMGCLCSSSLIINAGRGSL